MQFQSEFEVLRRRQRLEKREDVASTVCHGQDARGSQMPCLRDDDLILSMRRRHDQVKRNGQPCREQVAHLSPDLGIMNMDEHRDGCLSPSRSLDLAAAPINHTPDNPLTHPAGR
jgi:hypothetical protein